MEEHEHRMVFTHNLGINKSLHNFSLSLWSIVRVITPITYRGRSDLRHKALNKELFAASSGFKTSLLS